MAAWRGRVREVLRFVPYLLRPGTVVLRRFSHALGDNLMLTMLARELKRERPERPVVVETTWPELFAHNPNVDLAVRTKVAPRYRKPGYRVERDTAEHILDQLASSARLDPARIERRVDLILTPEEERAGVDGLPQEYAVVCPQGKGTMAGNRKDWGFDNFQAVVDGTPELDWVQIGLDTDTPLRGVTDRRGLGVRSTAAVLKGARVAVILEGGLMHLANAVRTPAVVIYGGAIRPEVSRYPDQLAVAAPEACGPCFESHGRPGDCGDRKCMARIGPERVVELLLDKRYPRGGVICVDGLTGKGTMGRETHARGRAVRS